MISSGPVASARPGHDTDSRSAFPGSSDPHASVTWSPGLSSTNPSCTAPMRSLGPGPKLRIGAVQDGFVELKPGDHVTLACGSDEPGNAERLSVSWPGLADATGPDEIIYLADGSVRLRVEGVRGDSGEIDTIVEAGGSVASRQGINVPGELAQLPAVRQEDL